MMPDITLIAGYTADTDTAAAAIDIAIPHIRHTWPLMIDY